MPVNPLKFKFTTSDGRRMPLEPGRIYVARPYQVYVEQDPKHHITSVFRLHRFNKRRALRKTRWDYNVQPRGRERWWLEVELLADNRPKPHRRFSNMGQARSFYATKFTIDPVEPIELLTYLDLPQIYPGMQEAITKGQ